MPKKCKCGKGHASDVDGICKFCRERLYRRSECKRVGVKHAGDGLGLDQEAKILAKRGVNNG